MSTAEHQSLTRGRGKYQIDEALRAKIAHAIVSRICLRKFGPREDIHSPRMLKIYQNTNLTTLQLLGVEIAEQEIDLYVEEYVSQYISAPIEVGEASGEISAQSLLQPITQATLKSQHRSGAREGAGGATLLQLNKLNVSILVFKIHMKIPEGQLRPTETQIQLSRKYEEVFLSDVLASTYGDSRYKPVVVPEFYSEQEEYVYLNHRDIWPSEVVHRFKMDPEKLYDAGLTQLDVFELLRGQTNLLFVLHPLSTFTFDIAPRDGQRNTAFSRKVEALMKLPIKGLRGLHMVGERTVKVNDAAPFICYDPSLDETTIYLDPNVMLNFPLDEFTKRVGYAETPRTGLPPSPRLEKNTLQISMDAPELTELAYLRYSGKVQLNQTPYSYFLFSGTLGMDSILETFAPGGTKPMIDLNHLVCNDALEMVKFVGITGARIAHEFAYSEALNAAGTPLLYQNITSICRRIFGIRLMPITPSGYLKGTDITPLEKLGFQNYRTVLEAEMVRGTRASTNTLPAAIMAGRRAKLGTGAMSTEPIQKRTQEVVELYSKARQEQKYNNKHKGIQFPPFGSLKYMTVLDGSFPSVNRGLKGI